jgi:hypothetical protein
MSLDAGWRRVRAYFGWVVGAFGLVLAWLAGFDLVEKFVHGQDALSVCANVYVVATAVLAISLTAYRQYISIRKEKYANISSNMHSVFHHIRNLYTLIDNKEPTNGTEEQYQDFIEECKSIFTIILDQLCVVFISLTSTHCRACIKVVYKIDSDAYVYTLTRDQNSKSKCYQTDNKRLKDNHDPLEQNRTFAELFSDANQKWHFICNDLTSLAGFHSTSVTAYQPEYATSTPLRHLPWRSSNEWPLPYRSTIACVIGQGPFARCDNLPTHVAGFLTVDSESRGVFEDRWDVQLMFSVADAIYPVIIRYLDLQNRANGQ